LANFLIRYEQLNSTGDDTWKLTDKHDVFSQNTISHWYSLRRD